MRLTRAQLFARNDSARAEIYAQRRVRAAIRHARWSAERYAKFLTGDGVADGIVFHGRDSWTRADRMALAGDADGIRKTMADAYQVNSALLDYATRMTVALVRAKRPRGTHSQRLRFSHKLRTGYSSNASQTN